MAAGQPRVIDPRMIPIYNGTGGTLSKGYIVNAKAASTIPGEVVLATATTDGYLGVVAEDIADATWGDCQVYGVALVIGKGAVAVGSRVMFGTGGKGDVATATNSILGIALTLGAADTLFEVALSGPGGGEMPG